MTILPRNYTITVPASGAWVYENVYEEESPINPKTRFEPRTILFSNGSDTDMYFKLLNEEDDNGDESAGIGFYLKAGTQLEKTTTGTYRIGLILGTAGVAKSCIVSVDNFSIVNK